MFQLSFYMLCLEAMCLKENEQSNKKQLPIAIQKTFKTFIDQELNHRSVLEYIYFLHYIWPTYLHTYIKKIHPTYLLHIKNNWVSDDIKMNKKWLK